MNIRRHYTVRLLVEASCTHDFRVVADSPPKAFQAAVRQLNLMKPRPFWFEITQIFTGWNRRIDS